jgi:hypothetical protein
LGLVVESEPLFWDSLFAIFSFSLGMKKIGKADMTTLIGMMIEGKLKQDGYG